MSSDAIIPPDVGAFCAIEPIETGLEGITATVTALTPEGVEAAKGLLRLSELPAEKLLAPALAGLAREIAMNIYPRQDIIAKHGLTNAQYEWLAEHNAYFKNALSQLTKEWQSIGSTAERLKHEALAALEAQLPTIASRMGRVNEDLKDAVEAAKLFARIAGVDAGTGGNFNGGEKFTISIDLGADTRITVGAKETGAEGAHAPKLVEAKTVAAVPAKVP